MPKYFNPLPTNVMTQWEADTISEYTSGAGVSADGVLLKDSQVTTDVILEKTPNAGVTADGTLLKDGGADMPGELDVDTINEHTGDAGVTIEGVLILDGVIATLNRNVIAKSANFTCQASESFAVYEIGAADKVATLPATAPGLQYTFVVAAAGLSAGTGFQIAPNAADKIMGNGFTSADNKAAVLAGAVDREGDYLRLEGDAAGLGWYIIGVSGTWTRAS